MAALDFWNKVRPTKMIPDITDQQLAEMQQLIRPVYQLPEINRFVEIDTTGVNVDNVAFTWSPKLGRPVQLYFGGINELRIMTFHTWAYYGFFKPTLREVYACIRQFVPKWRHVRYFWMDSEGMDSRNIIGDYHWCPCVLFGPEQTNVIDAEWNAFCEDYAKGKYSNDN